MDGDQAASGGNIEWAKERRKEEEEGTSRVEEATSKALRSSYSAWDDVGGPSAAAAPAAATGRGDISPRLLPQGSNLSSRRNTQRSSFLK